MERRLELTEKEEFRKGTDGYFLGRKTPHWIVIYLDSFRQALRSGDEELKGTPEDMLNILQYCRMAYLELEVKFSNAQDKNREV